MAWLLVLFGIVGTAEGHAMRQVQAEITFVEGEWHSSVWLEAWALYPEDGPRIPLGTPGDPNTAGSEWVETLDIDDHDVMREIAAGFLQHTFLLKLNDESLKAEYAFPDYEASPTPKLKNNASGNALMRIDMRGELPDGVSGSLMLVWNDDEYEPLALEIKIPSAKKSELRRIDPEAEPEELARVGKDGHVEASSQETSLVTWIIAGFRHILPLGLDHICFILGLVFVLGLLHGMGFASVMKELDLPEGQVIKPLVGFNLGVELGQVTVLVLAFVMTFWFIKHAKFQIFSKVASGMIALVGLYWTYERIFM